MLTAYPHQAMAENHAKHLEAGEGKVLDLQNAADKCKLEELLKPGSAYQFFYSATRDKNARQKLIKAYKEQIRSYSITNYRGNFVFDIKVEAGQLYGTYSYEKQTTVVLFYRIIKPSLCAG